MKRANRSQLPPLHWDLKSYELGFGFNPNDIILTGILDGEWFLRQIADGYASVEHGADADPSALTHRLH